MEITTANVCFKLYIYEKKHHIYVFLCAVTNRLVKKVVNLAVYVNGMCERNV